MLKNNEKSLLVCYISGLDLRRVNQESTPFLAKALKTYPWNRFTNLPSNELFPTLVTGVDPTQHGVWGVQLNQSVRETRGKRLSDLFPEMIATTFQGLLHLMTSNYDLAAIPPNRRRRFNITRTKYRRRTNKDEALFNIGGIPSVFDIIGRHDCHYYFNSDLNPRNNAIPHLCSDRHILEVFELYSLDRFQQWNLDNIDKVLKFYLRMDEFLGQLNEKCKSMGYTMMIVTDHGHEPIRESIDIISGLASLNLSEDDYTYFIEVSNARFWFHSRKAKEKIVSLLNTYKQGTVLAYNDMYKFGIPLQDDSFGEVFLYLDPGHIFFPHDFHHPLANLWLGISDPMQRSRFRDPRHKGNHGHLPHFATEASIAILLDKDYISNGQSGDILDVAPSILNYLSYAPPSTMKGSSLFCHRG